MLKYTNAWKHRVYIALFTGGHVIVAAVGDWYFVRPGAAQTHGAVVICAMLIISWCLCVRPCVVSSLAAGFGAAVVG